MINGKTEMDLMSKLELPNLSDQVAEFGAGDTVSVDMQMAEGERERKQTFRGVVIRGSYNRNKRPRPGATFVVRRVTYGIGVERTIPFYSPLLLSLKVERRGKVRRARIYYLRKLAGKRARIKRRA